MLSFCSICLFLRSRLDHFLPYVQLRSQCPLMLGPILTAIFRCEWNHFISLTDRFVLYSNCSRSWSWHLKAGNYLLQTPQPLHYNHLLADEKEFPRCLDKAIGGPSSPQLRFPFLLKGANYVVQTCHFPLWSTSRPLTKHRDSWNNEGHRPLHPFHFFDWPGITEIQGRIIYPSGGRLDWPESRFFSSVCHDF